MFTQGKNINKGIAPTVIKDMNYNLWPYSNCWDRSTNPKRLGTPKLPTAKQTIGFFFSGQISNSEVVRQKVPDRTILF